MSRSIPHTLAVALVVTGASLSLAIGAQAKTPPKSGAASSVQATATKPTDGELKDRIEHRLETSTMVGKYDIKVSVNNGVATLSGDVATEAQKADAARLAKVTGVSNVENNITVNKDVDKTLVERTKKGLTKTGEAITDAWITTKVKWFFLGEDALKGSDINVDTKDHIVTLKGTVKTAAGKARAASLAKQTDGVKNVVNQLTISAK
jgi:hyperosmotically inducible protein